MKRFPVKTALKILAAVALVAGGVMIERLSRDTEEVPSKVPRYKSSVRIVEKNARVEDAPERIKAVQSPELLQKVVDALDLTRRWNTEAAAARGRLNGMIEAQVETGAPEVLIVTVRSTDKKEPEEIAAALTRAMARRLATHTDEDTGQEIVRNWTEEFKEQQTVLEDARAKIAAVLLSGMRQRPTQKHSEIRDRAGAIQDVLRVVRSRNGGRDPAIAISEEEKREFQNAVTKLKEKSGGELSAQDLETLELVNATAAEGADLGARQRELQSRLESRLQQTKKELQDETVAPEFRDAYAKAKEEYETEFERLNVLREQAARQNPEEVQKP